MSYLLPHLRSGWEVDQAILGEENKLVIIRFGHDWVNEFLILGLILYDI
jgi:DIM1 family U5 snRNP protein